MLLLYSHHLCCCILWFFLSAFLILVAVIILVVVIAVVKVYECLFRQAIVLIASKLFMRHDKVALFEAHATLHTHTHTHTMRDITTHKHIPIHADIIKGNSNVAVYI